MSLSYRERGAKRYKYLNCPCRRDCEGRCATCHATCAAYIEYETRGHARLEIGFRKMINDPRWYFTIKKADNISKHMKRMKKK